MLSFTWFVIIDTWFGRFIVVDSKRASCSWSVGGKCICIWWMIVLNGYIIWIVLGLQDKVGKLSIVDSVDSVVRAYISKVIFYWTAIDSTSKFLSRAVWAYTVSLVTVIPLASLGLCSAYGASESSLWTDKRIRNRAVLCCDDNWLGLFIVRDFIESGLSEIDAWHRVSG